MGEAHHGGHERSRPPDVLGSLRTSRASGTRRGRTPICTENPGHDERAEVLTG